MDNDQNQAAPAAAPKKSFGPVIGIIIIVLVLILGGLYLWGEKLNEGGYGLGTENTEEADAQTTALSEQSSSDTAASIEADLNATNLDGLDAGLEEAQP